MKNKNIRPSILLGKGLAHVQDIVDRGFFWGFKTLKSSTKNSKKEENKLLRYAKRVGGFVGEAGSEYYKEYESLKTKREKIKSDN